MMSPKKSRIDASNSQYSDVAHEFNAEDGRPGNIEGGDTELPKVVDDNTAIALDLNPKKDKKRKQNDDGHGKMERKKRKKAELVAQSHSHGEEDAPADGDDLLNATPYTQVSNTQPPDEHLIAQELEAQQALHEQHMQQLMNYNTGIQQQQQQQEEEHDVDQLQDNKKRHKPINMSVYDDEMASHDDAIAAQAAQAAHEAVQFQEPPAILPPSRNRHSMQNMETTRYPEEMMHHMHQPMHHQYPQMYYPHPATDRLPMNQLLDPALQGHSFYDHHPHSFEPQHAVNMEQPVPLAEPQPSGQTDGASHPSDEFVNHNPDVVPPHLVGQILSPVKPKRRLQTGSPGPEQSGAQKTAIKKSSAVSSVPREKKPKAEKKPVPGNSGKFSEEELATLRSELQKYREANNITVHEQNALLAEPMAGVTKELYNQLCEALPERARISISKICRRRFHNYEKRGAWNEEEDEELRRLQASQPNKWKQIGDALARHPEDARDRWRNYLICGDNLVKNQWSLEEENDLRRIVDEALRKGAEARQAAAVNKPQESTTEPDMNFVDWQAISKAMDHKRSRLQCMAKWKRLTEAEADTAANQNTGGKDLDPFNKSWRVGAAMETYKELSKTAKLELVRAIQDSESTRESKVPWNKLTGPHLKPYATMVKKIAWATMRDTIPGNENIPVQDICKALLPRLADPEDPFGVPEAPIDDKLINVGDGAVGVETKPKAKRGRKPREPKSQDDKAREQKPKGAKVVKSKLRDGMDASSSQAYGDVQGIAEHALLAGEDGVHRSSSGAILPPMKQRGRPRKVPQPMSSEYVYDDAMPLQDGYTMHHDEQVAAVAPMMVGDAGEEGVVITEQELHGAEDAQMHAGAEGHVYDDGYTGMEEDVSLRIQPGLQDIV